MHRWILSLIVVLLFAGCTHDSYIFMPPDNDDVVVNVECSDCKHGVPHTHTDTIYVSVPDIRYDTVHVTTTDTVYVPVVETVTDTIYVYDTDTVYVEVPNPDNPFREKTGFAFPVPTGCLAVQLWVRPDGEVFLECTDWAVPPTK